MFLEDIYSGPVARGDVGARCRGGGCDRYREREIDVRERG